MILDDIINGNASYYNPSLFFTGIKTFTNELKILNSNINTLDTEIGKLTSSSSQITDTKNKINTAKASTTKIPSSSGAALSFNYNTPISAAVTTGTIQSLFPTVLGSSTNSASLVGVAYSSLVVYENLINSISSAADNYQSKSAGYASAINQAISTGESTTTDL